MIGLSERGLTISRTHFVLLAQETTLGSAANASSKTHLLCPARPNAEAFNFEKIAGSRLPSLGSNVAPSSNRVVDGVLADACNVVESVDLAEDRQTPPTSARRLLSKVGQFDVKQSASVFL